MLVQGLIALTALATLASVPRREQLRPTATASSFDVATIKPTGPNRPGGTMNLPPGGTFTSTGIPLKFIIAIAYGVSPQQISGGASWVEAEPYDIVAKAEGIQGRIPLDKLRPMLQTLFEERLKLMIQRTEKEASVYVLSVDSNGHKLKPIGEENAASPELNIEPGGRLPGRNATMTEFAIVLQTGVLDRPVIDRTGLTGRFDFDLAWDAEGRGLSDFPNIFTALKDQLGLKVDTSKELAPAIVIQSIKRPEN